MRPFEGAAESRGSFFSASVDELKRLQAEAVAEPEALLLSALDKTKGNSVWLVTTPPGRGSSSPSSTSTVSTGVLELSFM